MARQIDLALMMIVVEDDADRELNCPLLVKAGIDLLREIQSTLRGAADAADRPR